MSKPHRPTDPNHEMLLLLDRLEELREDLEELGIASIEELHQRIAELEGQLEDDEVEDGPV